MTANNHQRSPIRLDLVPNDLLTPEDMFTLTGYEDPRYQSKVLSENNIFHLKIRRNEIRTTWYHVNNPTHLRVPHLAPTDSGVGWNKSFNPRVDSVPEPDATDLASTLDAYNN